MFISLLAAAVAGLTLSTWAGNNAKNAGPLFVEFSGRYRSRRMMQALRLLVEWYLTTDRDRFDALNTAISLREAKALNLFEAAGVVAAYYHDLANLYELNLIGRRVARKLVTNVGLNVLYVVAEPILRARHSTEPSAQAHRTLRFLARKFGDGHIVGVADQFPGSLARDDQDDETDDGGPHVRR